MAKQSFMPRNDADKQLWLQNFANKLGTYGTKYVISAAEVTDMQESNTYFTYWLNYTNQYNEYLKKLTGYKNELKDGIVAGATAAVVPTPPVMAAVPTAVAPGVFKRAAAIAGVIKSRTNYTEADGKDLGIEGTEIVPPDLINAKPSIGIRLVQGGKPEVMWAKGDFDGVDIYADRGNGTWVFIATDNYPNYIDNTPLPATGTAAVWKYKAIYKYDDEQVGAYSDVVSITVGS